MKKIKIPKIQISVRSVIIFILCFSLVYGLVSWVKMVQENQKNHDEFRGNIENLYYYLKKEPSNMEMYSLLNKGDSVALSVWNNYISTLNDNVKKYEKQLKNMIDGILPKSKLVKGVMVDKTYESKKYPEYFLAAEMQKALVIFKGIQLTLQAKIEDKKGFDEKKYQAIKTDLTTLLKKITEEAKKVNLDLR